MMRYAIGTSNQTLIFTPTVLDHFWRHRQRTPWAKEAGGQLFGHFLGDAIEVVDATGPRKSDLRTRCSYEPCRKDEQSEINERQGAGLIFLGDWHTHAHRRPLPSEQDRWNVADIVRKSQHVMNGMLMVIVGTERARTGLYVSVSDGAELYELSPVEHGSDAEPLRL